jgi:hypothetical protein
MKTKLLSLAIAICVSAPVLAQDAPLQVGFGYVYTNPTGGMKQYIRQGNGLIANVYWNAPSQRVSVGFEMNFSGYGMETSTQDYEFPDGTIAPMKIQVSNSFTNYTGNLRLYMLTSGLVRPYAEFKAGYASYSTKLLILDPNDLDSCEPVDSEILKKDGTAIYSAGGGVRIDLATLSRHGRPGRAYLDFSSNVMQGGRVSYMNSDAPAQSHLHTTTRSNDLQADFVNTQTQVVHKHHVGYVYESYVQAIDFRVSLQFSMGGRYNRIGTIQ